jgi:D-alanyl-D-alanine carboxypeptidase
MGTLKRPATAIIATLALAAFATEAETLTESDLQTVLNHYQVSQKIPGISAVVTRGDEIVFAGASGVADIETGREMTPDTVLYAGSLSKIFTVVVTLSLIDDGKLSIDQLVPEIATTQQAPPSVVRVSHLLTHSSGLEREGEFGYWFTADFPDRAELAEYLANTSLMSTPGTSTTYSNIGFAALGPVIEAASALSYEDALLKYVFLPVSMKNSGVQNPPPSLSAGYSPVDRVLPNSEKPFAGLGRQVGNRYVREYHNARAMTPAFGVYTSARDLSRLARVLLGVSNVEVISKNALSQMLSDQGSGRGFSIRLEQYKGRSVARHGGWFAAHRTHLLLDLESGISVSIMANSDSASPESIAEGLLDAALLLR